MKETISQNQSVTLFGNYVKSQEDPVLRKLAEDIELSRQFFETDRRMTRMEAFAEGYAEGYAEGFAEGLKEGLAEARAEGRVKFIKRILTKRFGSLPPAVAEALDKKIAEKADEAECDRLFDLAMDCASVEQFQRGL